MQHDRGHMGVIFAEILLVVLMITPVFADEASEALMLKRLQACRVMIEMEASEVLRRVTSGQEACDYVELLCRTQPDVVKGIEGADGAMFLCLDRPDCTAEHMLKFAQDKQQYMMAFLRPSITAITVQQQFHPACLREVLQRYPCKGMIDENIVYRPD